VADRSLKVIRRYPVGMKRLGEDLGLWHKLYDQQQNRSQASPTASAALSTGSPTNDSESAKLTG
jgi:hypothetical protein